MEAVISVHAFGSRKKFASGLLKPSNRGGDSVFMVIADTHIHCRSVDALAVKTFAGLLANRYTDKPFYLHAC